MNLEEIIIRLRIEEDNRGSKKKVFNPNVVKANVMEYGQSSINKITKPRLGSKWGVSKKKF